MGKLLGFQSAAQLGRRIGRSIAGLGASGPVDWWTVWYRAQAGQPWAQVGWFALGEAYKPVMGDYNCDRLRLIRPAQIGSTTTNEYCGRYERYDALLPGRLPTSSLGAAKYWWVYGVTQGYPAWQWDGWLWANPAIVAALRALPPKYPATGLYPVDQLYIGG